MARGKKNVSAADVEKDKITSVKELTPIMEDMCLTFDKLPVKYQLDFLNSIGVGTNFLTCQRCGKVKEKKDFYSLNGKEGYVTKTANVCIECATNIASPVQDGVSIQPNKITLEKALYEIDRPYLNSVWEKSVLEHEVKGTNTWQAYMRMINTKEYVNMTYRDSDNYVNGVRDEDAIDRLPADKEMMEQFERNKRDALKLVGYLPFEKEEMINQPLLYSQFIGLLDAAEEGNSDTMRIMSIISIVRGFAQMQKIDDQISELIMDMKNAERNMQQVKNLTSTKKSINDTILSLAKENCISLNNTKNAKKGENTWTGKLKRLKEINLREFEVNGFDLYTCKGMQQVADISMSAILKSLHMDESEYSEIIADQRVKLAKAISDSRALQEGFRLLLRENLDLRNFLKEKNLLDEENLLQLDDVVNTYVHEKLF